MRPTVLEVDLDAIAHNLKVVTQLTNGLPVLAVVKANAYGHGLVPVSRTLLAAGAAFLGVATVSEGQALRQAGIDAPVLLLGGYLPEEADDIARSRLTATLFTTRQLASLARAAEVAGVRMPVHVKVDTGMGRIGFSPGEAAALLKKALDTPQLEVEGVFTHFAEADLADSPAAEQQLARLAGVRQVLGADGERIPHWHVANSAAVMREIMGGGDVGATLCRPGIMLYGEPPSANFKSSVALSPVATWKARVIQIKDVPAGTRISYGGTFVTTRPSRIATLPVGYADGFRRQLSNRGEVLIRGQRVPVVGRVCMDMTLVDVTDLPQAFGDDLSEGEEAVLIGRQGNEVISATEMGAASDTISYDILCGISERVPRRYLEK
ncbi:MAG: alanine racemase [Leptospirillia bacterium]